MFSLSFKYFLNISVIMENFNYFDFGGKMQSLFKKTQVTLKPTASQTAYVIALSAKNEIL